MRSIYPLLFVFSLCSLGQTMAQSNTLSLTLTDGFELTPGSTTIPISATTDLNLTITYPKNFSNTFEKLAIKRAKPGERIGGATEITTLTVSSTLLQVTTTITAVMLNDPETGRIALFAQPPTSSTITSPSPIIFWVKTTGPTPERPAQDKLKGPGEILPDQTFNFTSLPVGPSCGTRARIVYNFSNQQFRFFKRDGTELETSNNNSLKRFHPIVDEMLSIRAISYNPTSESLTVAADFLDNNLENRGLFKAQITPSSSTSATSTTPSNSTKAAEATANGGNEGQIRTVKDFANSLEAYQLKLGGLNECQFQQDIKAIKQRAFDAGLGSDLEEWITRAQSVSAAENDIERITRAYRAITSVSFFQFPPIQVKSSDLTKLTFNFHKVGRSVETRDYYFANRGGFKIDFSTGIGATGLIDKSYSTTATSTTITSGTSTAASPETIIERNEGDFRLGIVVLSHAYFRTGARLNVALTGGFMIDNNVATRYLAGGSLILGREQRLILSGGWAIGKVKRLDDGLKVGGPYTYGSGTRTVPVKDQYNHSWFFTVTFNLGGT